MEVSRIEELLKSLDYALDTCSTTLSRTHRRISTSRRHSAYQKRRLINDICHEGDKEHLGRPHNRSLFLARLKTFTASFWFAKPSCISASECARHGWICSSPNTLSCAQCGSPLAHNEINDPLGVTTASVLSSSHHEDCCWRTNTSPTEFAYMPFESNRSTLSNFISRLSSFVSLAFPTGSLLLTIPDDFRLKFPQLSSVLLAADKSLLQILNKICLTAEIEETNFPSITTTANAPSDNTLSGLSAAVILAACGWKATSTSTLKCDCCGRSINTAALITTTDSSSSLTKETPPRVLMNILSEHRTFCPWVVREEEHQNNESNLIGRRESGWVTCCEAIIGSGGSLLGTAEASTVEGAYKRARQSLGMASSFNT